MKLHKNIWMMSLLFTSLSLGAALSVKAEEYRSLEGLDTVKAVVDVRSSNPQMVSMVLEVLLQTFKDKDLSELAEQPEFSVVFIGPSVKLLTKDHSGFSTEDQKALESIGKTITEMSNAGVRLEICGLAAKFFKIEPSMVYPEFHWVNNGIISAIGYQNQGFALVPLY